MFETATLNYGQESKRALGTLAGMTGQALLVTCAVIAPMISPSALPRAAWIVGLTAPGPPPPPPPVGTVIRPKATQTPRPFNDRGFFAPSSMPAHPQIIVDSPDDVPVYSGPGGVPGGVSQGREGGVVGSPFIDSILSSVRPAPAVVRAPDPVPTTIRETTVVKPPRISVMELARPIHRVDPVYPPVARMARVQGVVELQGVLGTDGRIHELKVLHGHPLLIKAAVDAVLQWTYAPTILNGQPVEVIAPIIVTFRLN